MELLSSDKIKDRNDGLAQIRPFLNNKRNFTYLQADPDHKWNNTFQTLYELVRTEQNTVHRGGKSGSAAPATSVKRLEDAAGTVRFLVEKLCEKLPKKTAKGLFKHLSQMICVVGGKLPTYALTYLRTLRVLLSFQPHLDHMDERQWSDIVSLCFSAALGDPIKIGQEFTDKELMDLDDDGEVGRLGGRNKDKIGPALRTGLDDVKESIIRRTATQEDIELLSCIEAAFRCTAAPLITLALPILIKFLRFFKQFESETTAHLPALSALNRTFAALELNNLSLMRQYGPLFWPHIISLWSTKNTAQLKEQVIIAIQYLLPFVAPPGKSTVLIENNVKFLFSTIMEEPVIRWRTEELSIDSLRLGLAKATPASASRTIKPFDFATFRYGNGFTPLQAMAWGMLELGSNTLAKVYLFSENVKIAEVQGDVPEGSSKKRRKVSLLVCPF